jgi:hypothetical protein
MNAIARWTLTLVVLAGLTIDAYIHFDLASSYVGVPSPSFITQYGLFIVEACLATAAGIALLVRQNRITAGIATVVLGGGALAVWVYYEYKVGKIGPIPDMSDHTWYPKPKKALSFIAELVGFVAGLGLLAVLPRKARTASPSHASTLAG